MIIGLRYARILFLVLTLGVVGVGACATPANAGAPVALKKVIDAGYPGAVAAVRTGKDLDLQAQGVADLRTGRQARASDTYRIGSIAKTMVSTVILQLVNEGKLALDTKVATLLPNHGLDNRIAVRHLLQHTSGFHTNTMAFSPPYSVDGNRFRTFAPEDLVKLALTNPEPRAVPGTKFEYSNTNYVIAGLLIEKITGSRAESELKRRIFKPLHLRDTYLSNNPHMRGRHLRGYLQDETGKAVLDYTVYNMSWAWTAGGVTSTVADETAFLHGLFTGRLLPKRLLAEMMDAQPFGYGLGLFAIVAPCVEGGLVWGHNGGVFGYQSVVMSTPDGERQVAIGANAVILTDSGAISPAVDQAVADAFCPNSGQVSRMLSQSLVP